MGAAHPGHAVRCLVHIPLEGITAVKFTHLDRVYWPELGATKRDLVDYYRALAPTILPHVRDRPFTLKQHYTVPRGPYRFVKDAPPELPRTLDILQLASYVRTSGGEGLHVLVPIARRHTHHEARRFATIVAGALRLERAKIDTKMIGHGQQVVAGYSVRPLPYAPVATPLEWDELNPRLDPREHNLQTVPQRVAELGDLHSPLLRGRQSLEIGTRLRNN